MSNFGGRLQEVQQFGVSFGQATHGATGVSTAYFSSLLVEGVLCLRSWQYGLCYYFNTQLKTAL